MRINHNLSALNAWRALGQTDNAMTKSLERLSSGLRINRAADDAAGLAISEKMRGQIRGLNQAIRNAQDAISLIQTAEGALNETHAILQRMRELAVQAASDTNTDADRAEIQKEIDQLAQELTRIGNTTEFNTMKLLNGTFEGTFHIGANATQNLEVVIGDVRADSLGVASAEGAYQELKNVTISTSVDNTVLSKGEVYTIEKLSETANVGGATNGVTDAQYVLRDSDGNIMGASENGTLWKIAGNDGTLTDEVATTNFGNNVVTLDVSSFGAITTGEITVESIATGSSVNISATATLASDVSGLTSGIYTVTDSHALLDTGELGLVNEEGEIVAISSDGKQFNSLNGDPLVSLAITLGSGDVFTVSGEGGIDVSTQKAADKAITVIQNALDNVSSERSKLGAIQNRLEHTIANLGVAAENLTAAESRIRDVDMAQEMMEFTKNQILIQAGTAMLANANVRPQSVLQLLG